VAATRDNDAGALARFDSHVMSLSVDDVPAIHYFAARVNVCQLARLAGDRRLARRRLKESQKLLSELPAAVTPDFTDLARHHANVLKLTPRGEGREQSQAWLQDLIAKGYLFFRTNLPTHP
jgi:hypothetical protein